MAALTIFVFLLVSFGHVTLFHFFNDEGWDFLCEQRAVDVRRMAHPGPVPFTSARPVNTTRTISNNSSPFSAHSLETFHSGISRNFLRSRISVTRLFRRGRETSSSIGPGSHLMQHIEPSTDLRRHVHQAWCCVSNGCRLLSYIYGSVDLISTVVGLLTFGIYSADAEQWHADFLQSERI
jgi:hypothetical protein